MLHGRAMNNMTDQEAFEYFIKNIISYQKLFGQNKTLVDVTVNNNEEFNAWLESQIKKNKKNNIDEELANMATDLYWWMK